MVGLCSKTSKEGVVAESNSFECALSRDPCQFDAMKICVFCGNPGGNLEHIIAQWLIQRMGAVDYPVVVAHRKEDGIKTRPPHLLNTYTTRSVCQSCNNGWMSTLENWFKTNLGILVEPTWPKLANELIRSALVEKEMLAKWALKTVIMMDANSMMEPVTAPGLATSLYTGHLPPEMIVEIGFMQEKAVGGLLTHGFWIRNGANPVSWQKHKSGQSFKAVIQMNHLAIRVFRAPNTHASYLATNARLPLRCYPTSQDPNTVDFRFHDVMEFDQNLELETWLGA
jgi:hypothetical protein